MDQDTKWTSAPTIGLDVSDRRTQACALDDEGQVRKRFSFPSSQVGLEKAAARLRLEAKTPQAAIIKAVTPVVVLALTSVPGRSSNARTL